jgi:DeoR/GlpR family transcriptional regulator of sugar metabolism
MLVHLRAHESARIFPFVLTEERKGRILELLRQEGRVLSVALAEGFGVSEDTIRRDLRELAADGRLKRVHGGALPLSRAAGASLAERGQADVAEKRALAAAGARLVSDGQTILVDGGTTNLLLAQALPQDLAATVITTSPAVALALAGRPRLEVVLPGGRLLPGTGTLVGPDTVATLRAVRADLCFLGVCSLDTEAGITCTEREETFVKRALIEGAGEVAALATADKLEAVATHAVAPVSELTRLFVSASVTEALPEARVRRYAQLGVELVPVPAAAGAR